jgi:hypothetical protein
MMHPPENGHLSVANLMHHPLLTYSVDSIKRTVHLAFHGLFFS